MTYDQSLRVDRFGEDGNHDNHVKRIKRPVDKGFSISLPQALQQDQARRVPGSAREG